MNLIDIILLIVLGGFVLAGLWFGVVHMIGSLVGLILGVVLAGVYFDEAARLVAPWLGGNVNLASTLCFIIILVGVSKLFGLVVALVDRVFKFLSFIPFLKTFNRLLGALLGLIEGTLALGLAVYFAGKFPASAAFELLMRDSSLAKTLNVIGGILAPLLPESIRLLQSFIR